MMRNTKAFLRRHSEQDNNYSSTDPSNKMNHQEATSCHHSSPHHPHHHHAAAATCSSSSSKHRHHHSSKPTTTSTVGVGSRRRLLLLRLVWVLAPMGLLYTWQQYQTHRHLNDIVMALQQQMDDVFLGGTRSSSNSSNSVGVGASNLRHHPSIAAAESAAAESADASLPLPHWTIFYNVFIPKSKLSSRSTFNNSTDETTATDAPVENAKRIVMEQIDMIRRSFAGGAGGDAVHVGKNNKNKNNNSNNNNKNDTTQQQQQRYQPVKVYYNTIGNGNVITPSWMHELCTRQQPQRAAEGQENTGSGGSGSSSNMLLPILDCHFMQHYPNAFEEVTLQKLYEHCQNAADDDDDDNNNSNSRVVYLHSKGSYHDHIDRRNEHWRRHGTLAATSRDCIQPPSSSSSTSASNSSTTCNLCGLQFWTYWVHFVPGNFWTAQCSYIQKLLPPMDFMHRINQVSGEAMLWTLEGKFSKNMMFAGRNDHFGIDRFASEHWVGSHPDLIPCDVSPSTTGFGHWISGGGPPQGKQDAFEFGMAPRRDGSPVGEEVKTRPVIVKNETLRKKEFFLLPGRLFKWMRLYQKVPPSDSWIWKWYPDGEYWKQAVEKYGNETLEIMLGGGGGGGGSSSRDISENRNADIAIATTSDNVGASLLDVEQSPKWAIFHHTVLPTTQQQQQEHQQSVAKQLDWVSQSYAANSQPGKPVTIFYNAVRRDGFNVTENDKDAQDAIQNLCSDEKTKASIRCQPIQQQQQRLYQGYTDSNDDRSLHTLQSLMDFCQTHESWRVVYIHSNDNDDIDLVRKHQEILAATSALCLEPNNNINDECNLCGLEFSTQPVNSMKGNIFAAKCEYINKLVPPRMFEAKMQNLAKQSLLMRAQEKFRMTLFQEVGMEHFGIGQFASQQWVSSHPQVKPCDVLSKDATSGGGVAESTMGGMQAFSWSMAPRAQTFIQLAGWAPNKKRQLDLNRLKRAPEYFYLAGRLFKWLALYNETPSESSWVWDHFPDGKEWKGAIDKFGHDVVNQVLDHPPLLFGSSPDSNDLRVDTETSPGWTIFYNLYIQEADVQRGLRIFEEQIQQVRDSYAASIPGKPVTVFYNTIGKAVNQTFFDGICSLDDSLICKHMAHYDEGDEGITEQAVWDYCKIEEHSQHRAVYIHSKGSYHGWEANDFWRRHSTMAVTSQECLNPPDKSCNICGLQFYPVWNIFFPGNFWAAECKYLAKLISPDDFPRRLEKMAVQLRKYEKEQRLFANKLYDHGLPWANGADRYAWEIWSGTHPSINPCDVSITADHDHWRTQGNRTKDEFVWSMGPRHANLEGPWLMLEDKRRKNVLDKFGLRMRDYFILPGNLVKWFALYNEAPPDSSWVWNWFPDGKAWKRAVQTHGTQAFEKMTDRWDKSLAQTEVTAEK